MDWLDLAKFAAPMIKAGLPTIGGLIGSAMPIPGGSAIGSAAGAWIGSKIAVALGVPETPEAVAEALNKDPQAIEKLTAVENEASIELEKWKAQLADVQDARATGIEYIKSGSLIAYAPVIVSSIILVGFMVFSFLAMKPEVTGVKENVTLFLLGAWSGYTSAVVSYWLGSSMGSSQKSDQLAILAASSKAPTITTVPKKK